jgi:hypothetical protein
MKDFKSQLLDRLQKTALNMLKLSFLSWLVGIFLIFKKIIPCNNIVEFGFFSACLICSAGIAKRLKK